jgi:SAM-dependent methyltransferase
MPPADAVIQGRRQFLAEYGAVRSSEGRGGDDANWYYALPYRDLNGRFTDQWTMRGRSWKYFEHRVLPRYERRFGRALRIFDLGAGNCWMSWRLARRGHAPVAMDIFADERDGLRASRFYRARTPFPVVEAEFDNIPAASFHYSRSYERTLAEVRRVLRPDGAVVIMDSPVYKCPEHGQRMVEERRERFRQQYGFASDAQGSIEYLDDVALARLGRELGIRWTVHKPWYGLRWHSRPLRAWIERTRPPSRFRIIAGDMPA